MKLDFFDIHNSHELDDDLGIMKGFGDITAYLDDDRPEKIGTIIYYIYNTYLFDGEQSIIINADSISGDQLLIMDTILNRRNRYEPEEGGMIVAIEHILINEKYNTAENEKSMLREFIKYCHYMMFDYLTVIAIRSGSLDEDESSVLEFPQLKMYEDLNFVNIGGYDKKAPVMIKNMHLRDD